MAYAWTITRDILDGFGANNAVGISGPSDAPDLMLENLKNHVCGEGVTMAKFRLYDDDGELYYEGYVATDQDLNDEEVCYAPLGDFGMGYAGCTYVRYPGRPELDCG